jgi:hypothetical protein
MTHPIGRRLTTTLLLASLICLYTAAPAAARTAPRAPDAPTADITVCASGCDYTTIQDAMDFASAGDVVLVLDPVHTERSISVNKDVIIRGQGAANTVVQAADVLGSAFGSVFNINSGVTATIEAMTIRHATRVATASVGGVNTNNRDAWISGAAMAQANGGGISNRGTLTLRRCAVTKNQVMAEAEVDVQAIATAGVEQGDATATASATTAAYAQGGGVANFGTLTVEECSITDNTATITSTSSAKVYASVEDETATATEDGTANATGDAQGGGIYNAGTLTIINSTISGNEGESEANATVSHASPSPSAEVVSENEEIREPGRHTVARHGSGAEGPIVAVAGGDDAAAGSDGDVAPASIAQPEAGTATATAYATGGLYNVGAVRLRYVTVSNNETVVSAAASHSVAGTASTDIDHVGGVKNEGGTLVLISSIVVDQAAGPDCSGDATIISGGYNLDSDSTCIAEGVNNDLTDATPGLAPLAVNPPGETGTHALLFGSPALNRVPLGVNGCGDPVGQDQRGAPRPVPSWNGCDIGAYEEQNVPVGGVTKRPMVGTLLAPWMTLAGVALLVGTGLLRRRLRTAGQ